MKHFLLALLPLLLFSGCMVGPDYSKPATPTPAAYESLPPGTWQHVKPSDALARGKWWEIYNDPALNKLEEQVNISNQNVLQAEALYREARGLVRVAKSQFYPQVNGSPSVTEDKSSRSFGLSPATSGGSGVGSVFNSNNRTTDYDLPATLSWEIDLWGGIRRNVEENVANAQATEAQLANARLSYQAELAQDYFELHGFDSQMKVLGEALDSYKKYLTLTQNRYKGGIASQGDVAAAKAQLAAAKAALADAMLSRAQYEHAIAVLIGKPPSGFSIPSSPLQAIPPPVPVGVPSTLLERRPDIAQAERNACAANAAVGVATAAYYPTLTLNASSGVESSTLEKLFTLPSIFWSVGPSLTEPLFDAGKTHAQVYEARANYDAVVATYRQTVLTAFQQIEDDLAGLHYLEEEAQAENDAVQAAQTSLKVVTNEYKAGTAAYLDVITTQNIALSDEETATTIAIRRMMTSALLIQALGGGWGTESLPTPTDTSKIPQNPLQLFPPAAVVTGQAH